MLPFAVSKAHFGGYSLTGVLKLSTPVGFIFIFWGCPLCRNEMQSANHSGPLKGQSSVKCPYRA